MNVVYKLNGREVTPAEFDRAGRRRIKLHGGIPEMVRAGVSPTADTDEVHTRVNRSGLTQRERAMIARRARKLGLNEHVAYDPTVPGEQLYETRQQRDARIKAAYEEGERIGGKPRYRLHPRHVRRIKQHMLAQDPSLKRRDQKELEAEIIDRHAPPE